MSSKLGIMAASIMLGTMANPFHTYGQDRPDFRRPIKKTTPEVKGTESDLFAKSHIGKKSKRAIRREPKP